MRAIITVIGKDKVGILNSVSAKCAEHSVNINDVSQTIFDDMFCMIMLCDISKMTDSFGDFSEKMQKFGTEMGMSVHVMHETIFNSMHRI